MRAEVAGRRLPRPRRALRRTPRSPPRRRSHRCAGRPRRLRATWPAVPMAPGPGQAAMAYVQAPAPTPVPKAELLQANGGLDACGVGHAGREGEATPKLLPYRGPAGDIKVPPRLLMGPGPVNAHPRVLAAQSTAPPQLHACVQQR